MTYIKVLTLLGHSRRLLDLLPAGGTRRPGAVRVRSVLGKVDADGPSVDADPAAVTGAEGLLRGVEVLKLDERDAGAPAGLAVLWLVDSLDVAVPTEHFLEGDLVGGPRDVADVDGRTGREAGVRGARDRVLLGRRAARRRSADGGLGWANDGFAVVDDKGRGPQELLRQVGRGELDKGEAAFAAIDDQNARCLMDA